MGLFVEEADQIRVRLRSKGPVINELAKNTAAAAIRLLQVHLLQAGKKRIRFFQILKAFAGAFNKQDK